VSQLAPQLIGVSEPAPFTENNEIELADLFETKTSLAGVSAGRASAATSASGPIQRPILGLTS
jgi:hypothetical protein